MAEAEAARPRRDVGRAKAQEILTDAGFTTVETAHVDGDTANTYFIATKG